MKMPGEEFSRDMSFEGALYEHNLDVAAFELETAAAQHRNFLKWIEFISDPEEKCKAQTLANQFKVKYKL